jgi:hypothetical protein
VMKGDPGTRITDIENVEIVFEKMAWGMTRGSCSIQCEAIMGNIEEPQARTLAHENTC